jgi:hypothetical protein
MYACDFYLADEAFRTGRLETTTKNRTDHWARWVRYVKPLGVDPYLQNTPFQWKLRAITGFAARARTGAFGAGRTVKTCTVSGYLASVGQTIALACGTNPLKILGSDKYLPRLQISLDGWKQADPPTIKKLPVESDIPELLVLTGISSGSSKDSAIGDLTTIAFYYLLRVGEYTTKSTRANTKRTVQFKSEDITFFKRNASKQLVCLPRSAHTNDILSADGATLKLDNQKNGYKGVCIYQEANGDDIHCPVRALGRRFIHIRKHNGHAKTFICAYWHKGTSHNVTAEDISRSLKWAGTVLKYPALRAIPIERIDTHSLRIGGACVLALAGFSDMHIQKMGRWKGETFKEYVREELHCFSAGMSRAMKRCYRFVNISGHAFHDITDSIISSQS